MKKTLRKKFILFAMLAVTILLVVLIGAISGLSWGRFGWPVQRGFACPSPMAAGTFPGRRYPLPNHFCRR